MSDETIYPMRLQRFLARAGVASRRGSERLMTEGRVRVNGVVVTELGSKVDPLADEVTVDGMPCSIAETSVYLVLNKPAGYLTTMNDPKGRPCVASLVPCDRYPGLFPVGRLDADTTGVLLFTTNGMAGQNLLHPSHHVDKHYVALVEGVPTKDQLAELRRGVMLDDGPAAPPRRSFSTRAIRWPRPLPRMAWPAGRAWWASPYTRAESTRSSACSPPSATPLWPFTATRLGRWASRTSRRAAGACSPWTSARASSAPQALSEAPDGQSPRTHHPAHEASADACQHRALLLGST